MCCMPQNPAFKIIQETVQLGYKSSRRHFLHLYQIILVHLTWNTILKLREQSQAGGYRNCQNSKFGLMIANLENKAAYCHHFIPHWITNSLVGCAFRCSDMSNNLLKGVWQPVCLQVFKLN